MKGSLLFELNNFI